MVNSLRQDTTNPEELNLKGFVTVLAFLLLANLGLYSVDLGMGDLPRLAAGHCLRLHVVENPSGLSSEARTPKG